MKIYKIKDKTIFISDIDAPYFESKKWGLIRARQSQEKYYVARTENRKSIYFHREIMKAKKGFIVDHINGESLDCTRENLRVVNQSVNRLNSVNTRSDKKTNLPPCIFPTKSGKYSILLRYKENGKIIKKKKSGFETVGDAELFLSFLRKRVIKRISVL